jgi:sugar/nucleoside kinase (ribokinase family)
MGEKGSFVASARESFWLTPYPVEVVDATGAGDAYVAGFLAGIVQGLGLKEAGKLANATGAAAVSAMGATDGVKSLAQVRKIMAR